MSTKKTNLDEQLKIARSEPIITTDVEAKSDLQKWADKLGIDLTEKNIQEVDIYKLIASKELNIPIEEVTAEQRAFYKGKAFRIMYSGDVS